MRILFMGTPDIAAECLKALYAAGHDICAVYTRRDKPVGRKQVLTAPPVKEVALAHDTPVFQPRTLRDGSEDENIHALAPELIVVVAYGCILPKSVLEMPRYGCINLPVSLLPKYRGAAPIHYAILQGEKESGVTIMQMDIGMDTGDMLSKVIVPIGCEMTMGELHDELKVKGAELLVRTLDELASGAAKPEKQNDTEATYAKLLDRAMEKIDWNNPAAKIHDLVRGFNPAPGAFTRLPDGKNLKIWKTVPAEGQTAPAGTVTAVTKKGFIVACGSGALEVLEVQPESKKRMEAKVFCNGRGVEPGTVLGNIEG